MGFIIVCVVLISIGPDKETIVSVENEHFMVLAGVFGLLTGFNFALNLIVTKMMLSIYHLPTIQLNLDVCFAQSLLMLPVFVFDYFVKDIRFRWVDLLLYTLA